MAAPTYVDAGTGVTDAGGAWDVSSDITGAVGDIWIVQRLQDGSTAGAVSGYSGSNIEALGGTDNIWTPIVTDQPVGSPTAAYQSIFIGRGINTSAPRITGNNSTSEDLYIRFYRFQNVNVGTLITDVIENSTAGNATNGSGTSNTAADTAVTTLGPDRLALNFVAVNDDNAITAFTGETGGDWTLAVSPYAESSGTDGAIGLQIAYPFDVSLIGIGGPATALGTSAIERLATSFVAPSTGGTWTIASQYSIIGSPTDDLVIEIQTDNAGAPSETVLGSATLDVTSTTDRRSVVVSASLTASTTYWIVWRRSGSLSETNYYRQASGDGGTAGAYYTSGAWITGTTTRYFGVTAGSTGSTIDGGTGSITDSDAWGVVGFALIGTTVTEVTYVPRNPGIHFNDPALL